MRAAWVEIPLCGRHGAGLKTLVDASDFPLVSARRWGVNGGYAYSGRIALHRLIMDAPPRQIVDHISGDKLDNRRSNLRFASASLNTANTIYRRYKAFRGVAKCAGGWRAACQHGSTVRIAVVPTEQDAALLYDQFARELFGEFARLNFPAEGERAG